MVWARLTPLLLLALLSADGGVAADPRCVPEGLQVEERHVAVAIDDAESSERVLSLTLRLRAAPEVSLGSWASISPNQSSGSSRDNIDTSVDHDRPLVLPFGHVPFLGTPMPLRIEYGCRGPSDAKGRFQVVRGSFEVPDWTQLPLIRWSDDPWGRTKYSDSCLSRIRLGVAERTKIRRCVEESSDKRDIEASSRPDGGSEGRYDWLCRCVDGLAPDSGLPPDAK